MKTILRAILLLAISAVTLVGCQTSMRSEPGAEYPGPADKWLAATAPDMSNVAWGHLAAQVAVQSAPAGSLPSAGEELWVIVRPRAAKPQAADNAPGSGAMLCRLPNETTDVPVPLKHTDVRAAIAGYIATVDVTQRFHNPYHSKIEAVYVFPLPQNAAVSEFVMQIGDRRIRGIIRDRAEAEQIYKDARAQGHVASLLTQERPNIFTQKVANIEPGKQIDVHIRYFHTLAYHDGWYEFDFPMVVGPRFNPPASSDPIHAVQRGVNTPGKSIQYLRPDERSGHDIALALSVDAGVRITDMKSVNHHIAGRVDERGRYALTLNDSDTIPNKDFVFRYKVAGDQPAAAMMTHKGPGADDDTYFTLMLYPPADLDRLDRHPLELVFVLDCSGSMSGKPIEQAKAAVIAALDKMRPTDTFQIVRFSDSSSTFGDRPVPATPDNVANAKRYVRNLGGEGGTMMIEGIRQALGFPHDAERLRFVVFLTDGLIGDEAQILGEMRRLIGPSRVFSFGVGSSPNRYLMDRMAKLGRGAVAYLPLDERGDDVMNAFFDRIAHPAMTDIRIDWGGLDVAEVYPAACPDLFVGRPIILTGRIRNAPPDRSTIRMIGVAGSREIEVGLRTNVAAAADHPALPAVWARQKIASLMDSATYEPMPDLPARIKDVALDYNLMSAYTAFVAVDSTRRTAGDTGTTVSVPVPAPDGVKYETTVSE